MILSTEEIIKEAKKLHPDITDATVDEVNNFLTSELNDEELSSTSIKNVTEKFLKSLIKTPNKSEN